MQCRPAFLTLEGSPLKWNSFDFLPLVTVPLAWHWFGWHMAVIAMLCVSHLTVRIR